MRTTATGAYGQATAIATVALMFVLVGASPSSAQFDRSTISGTVRDPQRAVVPGVVVTVTSAQTQQVRTAITDGSGFYTFQRSVYRHPRSASCHGTTTAPRR